MTEHRQGYQPKGEPPDELHPPTGGTGVQQQPTINGEPLSTKQLHELITSQAMTIDRLLGEIAKRDEEIKERKIMMAKYADMCEGYRKMNDDYQKMIEYYQHPQYTVNKKVKVT